MINFVSLKKEYKKTYNIVIKKTAKKWQQKERL